MYHQTCSITQVKTTLRTYVCPIITIAIGLYRNTVSGRFWFRSLTSSDSSSDQLGGMTNITTVAPTDQRTDPPETGFSKANGYSAQMVNCIFRLS